MNRFNNVLKCLPLFIGTSLFAQVALEKEISSPVKQSDQYFGASIAANATDLVVTTSSDDVYFASGSVKIFQKEGPDWKPIQEISSLKPAISGDFGGALAMSENWLFVGAPGEHDGDAFQEGAVYVYQKKDNEWKYSQRITLSTEADKAKFGTQIVFDQDKLYVGAPGYNQETGAVMIFKEEDGEWSQQQVIAPEGNQPGDQFGRVIAVNGSKMLISSLKDVTANGVVYESAGVVYAFEWDEYWQEKQVLLANEPESYEAFGSTLEISEAYAIIGSPDKAFKKDEGLGVFGMGAVSVWVRSGATTEDWLYSETLQPQAKEPEVYFGSSLALNKETLLVGMSQEGVGAISQYALNDNDFTKYSKLITSPMYGDGFGDQLLVQGHFLFVTAPNSSITNQNEGMVYTYSLNEDEESTAFSSLSKARLYPNPSKGELFIEGSEVFNRLRIYNLDGRKVVDRTIIGERRIDVSNSFSPGIHIVELVGESSVQRQQIIFE